MSNIKTDDYVPKFDKLFERPLMYGDVKLIRCTTRIRDAQPMITYTVDVQLKECRDKQKFDTLSEAFAFIKDMMQVTFNG